MNQKFEEWKQTTSFSNKSFFNSYVNFLKKIELSKRPSEFLYFFQLEKMRTTPLMSRLNYSCDDTDEYIDSLIIDIGCIDIVIIHDLPEKYSYISRQGGSWTMTEFKKYGYQTFEKIDEDRAIRKIHWDNENWLNVWAIPLHFRAVTYGDKDFRKEYLGGDLVYEGNQYGDTSDFYVIGSLKRKKKTYGKT